MEYRERILSAAEYLRSMWGEPIPGVGIILGSGLGGWADHLDNVKTVNVLEIPGWPQTTVEGHRGRIVFGLAEKIPVLALQGRLHFYEGYSMQDVVFPVRVLHRLGIRILIITNAAGGINQGFEAGDLMLISDHINMMGTNPLMGVHDPLMGTRFPDMSAPYDFDLIALAESVAKTQGVTVQKGVLAAVSGPSYETAAEVRMLRAMGSDAVCMSTIPEVIAGVQMGMRILGISCITNLATGLSPEPLSHDNIISIPHRILERFGILLNGILMKISDDQYKDD